MKSWCVILVLLSRIAKYPASVATALSSAPENPSVLFTNSSKSTLARVIFLVWMPRISLRPSSFGSGTWMSRSSLPGRIIAGSRMSRLFVHPMILTLSSGSNPSISASNCMNVRCTSLSPDVPTSILTAAIASISSIKMMLGAFSRAIWNISLTNFAPSPMNFCTSSEPTTSMNVLFVLAATAFARSVLPVPGGPYSSIPFGGSMPIFLNSAGFVRGSSMTSLISRSCCCNPPTRCQLTVGFSMITNLSASNLRTWLIFLITVRFFCSARIVSPGWSLSHVLIWSTKNSLPFGRRINTLSSRMSRTSHNIRGVLLNFSSSRSRLATLSRRNLFSSSSPLTFTWYP